MLRKYIEWNVKNIQYYTEAHERRNRNEQNVMHNITQKSNTNIKNRSFLMIIDCFCVAGEFYYERFIMFEHFWCAVVFFSFSVLPLPPSVVFFYHFFSCFLHFENLCLTTGGDAAAAAASLALCELWHSHFLLSMMNDYASQANRTNGKCSFIIEMRKHKRPILMERNNNGNGCHSPKLLLNSPRESGV